MLPKHDEKEFSYSLKLETIYENFKFITESASYRVFEAKTRNSQEKHFLRILDPTKELTFKNYDDVVMLFVQELTRLYNRCPGSVLMKTLEISPDRKQGACAIRNDGLVSLKLDRIQETEDLKDPKVIEKLLSDVISDVKFLWRDLRMKNIASIIEPENIFYLKEKRAFFLGNWDKILQNNTAIAQDLTFSEGSELRSQDIAAEMEALALLVLKIKNVHPKELEALQSLKKTTKSAYDFAVKSIVEEGFSNSQKLRDLIERMLSLDISNLPSLEEFKIKKEKTHVLFEKVKTETNPERKEVGIQVAIQESKINSAPNSAVVSLQLVSNPPTLLASCSMNRNKVDVIDLETKQSYVTFYGAWIRDTLYSRLHVREIPNTKLLVSLNHNYRKSANMEIYDISKKGPANKIYSLGEVFGLTGHGAVAYNSRRNILAAVPVTGRTAYHLFTIDTSSKTEDTVRLNRKSKWPSHYVTRDTNSVFGLDFDPAGEHIASIDGPGICLISAVNTAKSTFHLQLTSRFDDYSDCRWSTNAGEPLLFVKYDLYGVNILDLEKKRLTLTNPIPLDHTYQMFCIDVCQSDGNLLASDGYSRVIKIIDKRASKVVQIFEGIHSECINCLRWNPNGNILASASMDKTIKLLDFKTGKIIHNTYDPNAWGIYSVCFI